MAAQDAVLTFNWTYGTFDELGSFWDPAAYVIGDVYTQLTVDDSFLSQNGIVKLTVLAGQTYGFYVESDSISGRAHIAVSETPLPAAFLLFASGLGFLHVFSRLKKLEAP